MSALHQHLDDYLAIRRALGFGLRQEARMLASFVEFLEAEGAARVTVDAALSWATAPKEASPTWWAKRLTVVRGFATYLRSLDMTTEVPPHRLLVNRPSRTTPYLYSEAEILTLMAAARRLADPMRAATFEAFIGLMAATGMRTGEVMRLDRDDVDLEDAAITVRNSKHGKSRLVLLHETTSRALDRYAHRRDQLCPAPTVPAFFLSGAGTRLNSTNATTTFVRLLEVSGIAAPPGRRRPRLYDLRHSFAVATLVTWYEDDVDVTRHLPVLSAAMGHEKPSATYWYLEAAPELMARVADRLERAEARRS